jgi:hypothetical protein
VECESETSNRNYKNPQVPRGRNIMQAKNKIQAKNKQLDKSNLKASKGNEQRPIPTVVNGVRGRDKKTDQKHNKYKENTINKKKESKRHRVLPLRDSHMRGCTNVLTTNLNSKFGVSGIVKPGAKTKDILEISIDQDMSKDDIVVVCAGTNDIRKIMQKKE